MTTAHAEVGEAAALTRIDGAQETAPLATDGAIAAPPRWAAGVGTDGERRPHATGRWRAGPLDVVRGPGTAWTIGAPSRRQMKPQTSVCDSADIVKHKAAVATLCIPGGGTASSVKAASLMTGGTSASPVKPVSANAAPLNPVGTQVAAPLMIEGNMCCSSNGRYCATSKRMSNVANDVIAQW